MSCFRSGDPLDDFNRKDREESAWLASRPKCSECGEPIQSEKCYRIHGKVFCPDCIESFEEDVEE